MSEKNDCGKFYPNLNRTFNPLKPFTSNNPQIQSTQQGLECIGTILARSIKLTHL
jgi:hypothetical protein